MLLDQIEQGISKLLAENCDRKDLQISCSPLMFHYIEREFIKSFRYREFEELLSLSKFSRSSRRQELFGISLYTYHPYNEILIHHREYAYSNPKLLVKLEIDIQKIDQ